MQVGVSIKEGYVVDFKDLSLSKHGFDFQVGEQLFALYDGCEVSGGDCKVAIELDRSESMLVFDVDISGSVVVECDRCLDPCSVEIEFQEQLIVKFSDEEELKGEYDGEVMWIPTGATSIDLTHYIYESIILSLPYQRVHAEGECNEEMAKRFRVITGEEFDELEAASEGGESEGGESEGGVSVTMPKEELAKLEALKAMMEKED